MWFSIKFWITFVFKIFTAIDSKAILMYLLGQKTSSFFFLILLVFTYAYNNYFSKIRKFLNLVQIFLGPFGTTGVTFYDFDYLWLNDIDQGLFQQKIWLENCWLSQVTMRLAQLGQMGYSLAIILSHLVRSPGFYLLFRQPT